MHYNPFQPHWQLCDDSIKYKFHQLSFMKQAEMSLVFLLTIWIDFKKQQEEADGADKEFSHH
jgi:hypothetical protein